MPLLLVEQPLSTMWWMRTLLQGSCGINKK
jgi:hypothetical protein